jgi:hypothetical protein
MKSFQRYLDEQPIARRREILAQQKTWLEEHRPLAADQGSRCDPAAAAERDFEEQMLGYEEKPAGPPRRALVTGA